MNLSFSLLETLCSEKSKPIEELIVENTEDISTKVNISVIAAWASDENVSDSLDFLTICLETLFDDKMMKKIDSVYLYENKASFQLKKPKGFRKIGIYH